MKTHLRLGEFIFLLSRIDPENPVRFDFCGLKPMSFDSYRGYYDQLALGWEAADAPGDITAGELLKRAQDCVGEVFTGWKGGNYVMGETTHLWVANRGHAGSTAIVGVEDSYYAIIETAHLP